MEWGKSTSRYSDAVTSAKVTVWCALWASGIIGLYFFKNDAGQNVTVNGDNYRVKNTDFFVHQLNDIDLEKL